MTPKRILIVDDDSDLAGLAAGSLSAFGFEVIVAANGKSALDCLRVHHPQIIILDLTLPDVDGYTVLKLLRARERARGAPPVPVIIQSGRGLASEILCEDEGISGFIRKPYDTGQMLRAVSEVLKEPKRRAKEDLSG